MWSLKSEIQTLSDRLSPGGMQLMGINIALRTAGSVCPRSLPPQPHNKSEIQQRSVQKAYMAHSSSRLTFIDSFHHKCTHTGISLHIKKKKWSVISECLKVLLGSSGCIMHVAKHRFISTCIGVACPLAYVCFSQLSRSISRSVSLSD